MTSPERSDLTTLLNQWAAGGRREPLDEVIATVFDELRRIARSRLVHTHPGLTVQPTELVHEAYLRLRLRKIHARAFEDRSHFFALASSLIRSILVDHARERGATKRGRDVTAARFEELTTPGQELDLDRALVLDDALKRLAATHPRQSRVVELRLFGGLTMSEIADVMKRSQPTVERDWSLGRRRLARTLRNIA